MPDATPAGAMVPVEAAARAIPALQRRIRCLERGLAALRSAPAMPAPAPH